MAMVKFAPTGAMTAASAKKELEVLGKSCTTFLIFRDSKEELGEEPGELVAVGLVFTRGLATTAEKEGYRVFEYHP